MTKEDREAEIRDYVRYLDALCEQLMISQRQPRVVVVGFSQGGATAARWSALGAARIDRVILWGALLPPDLDLSKASATFRGASLTYAIGNRDQYISAEMIEKERVRLAVSKMTAEIIEFEGGHSIKRSVLADLSR
jgi:predicted esterase